VLYHTDGFAVVGMTEALPAELEPLGVAATVLCSGAVATGIIERTRTLCSLMGAIRSRVRRVSRRASVRR
jgi:short-subunit dehydrogenase